jgi:hypothetical protein
MIVARELESSYLEGNVFSDAATGMRNRHVAFWCWFRFRQDELKLCVGRYDDRRSGRHGDVTVVGTRKLFVQRSAMRALAF